MFLAAFLGFIQWSLVTLWSYIIFVVGLIIVLIPCIFTVLTNPKKLMSITNGFAFLSKFPLGKEVFSAIIGCFAPYSSSISPKVLKIELNGDIVTCVVCFHERHWVSNPYSSVHAIALANLGELTSGICVFAALEKKKSIMGIPVRVDCEYFKKGRGCMTGTSLIKLSDIQVDKTIIFDCIILDDNGDKVAKCSVTWNMKEKKKSSK